MKTIIATAAILGVSALFADAAFAASPAYCDGYARNYANQYANPAAGAVGGAVSGAVGGAILGGILGGHNGAGKGAAIGGTLGMMGGAANSGNNWQRLYNDAYYQCVGTPPAPPAPAYGGGGYGYPVGSNQWKQACAAKYKSFNWNTGYFTGYDGQPHLCQLP
jgi:hypothetical protein